MSLFFPIRHIPLVMAATGVRWVRFNLVGMMGFVLQSTILFVLVRWLHVDTAPAVAVAVLAAVSHNFFWHEHFTWPNLPRASRFRRWLSFHLSTGVISVLSNVAVTMIVARIGGLSPVASNAVAVAVVAVANYWISDRLIFRARLLAN